MIYSAFDWGSGKYRVFEDSTQVPYMSDPKSCVPMYRHTIGVDVNAALCQIPPHAKFIGWSNVARGQVSRFGGGISPITYGSRAAPNLGNSLGFLGQAAGMMRPLSLTEAVVYSSIISVVSGVISAWFFKKVQIPVK